MARGLHPMHLTHAHNLPRVRCGESATRRRRTTSPEELLRAVNQCRTCAHIARGEIAAKKALEAKDQP
jgi:hypothetical protein